MATQEAIELIKLLEDQHTFASHALQGADREALNWKPASTPCELLGRPRPPHRRGPAPLARHRHRRRARSGRPGDRPSGRGRERRNPAGDDGGSAPKSKARLELLVAAQYDEQRERRGRQVTVRWAAYHTLEHTAMHVGHMQLTRQVYESKPASPSEAAAAARRTRTGSLGQGAQPDSRCWAGRAHCHELAPAVSHWTEFLQHPSPGPAPSTRRGEFLHGRRLRRLPEAIDAALASATLETALARALPAFRSAAPPAWPARTSRRSRPTWSAQARQRRAAARADRAVHGLGHAQRRGRPLRDGRRRTPARSSAGSARERGAKLVVKGKSMVSEEIGLNPYLEAAGHQGRRDRPRRVDHPARRRAPLHLLAPALHKTREQIAELFSTGDRRAGRPGRHRGAGQGRAAGAAPDLHRRRCRHHRRQLRASPTPARS